MRNLRLVIAAFAITCAACSTRPTSASATSPFAGGSCPSLDSTDGSIIDAAGAVWTLVRGGDGALVVYVDGAPAGFTDWVQQLVYAGGVVSHENLSAEWYARTGGGWSAEADPTAACTGGGGTSGGGTPSANCATLDSTQGSLVDAAGNVWTLASDRGGGLVVDENGAAAGFTANVATLTYVGGVVSHENSSGSWYGWSGSGWSAEADPTLACSGGGNSGGGSGGSALFFDGFDTLDVTFDGSASAWMDHYAFGGSEFTLSWNNEAEYLCDAGRDGYQPFSVANGVLGITATSVARSGQANPKGLPWNSGSLNSCTEVNGEPAPGMFAHTYGYFEMRAQLPAGPGFWPAFVLYPLSGAGEIDIFEVLGNDPTTLYFTLHATTGGGEQVVKVADVSQAFHTYGCDWQPDFITLYIDGEKKAQMPTPSDMQGKPYYINIPFSVGGDGSWPGPTTTATPDPGVFQIDYVGVWSSFAAAHP